jgi:acyl-CoA dehydrogenase
VDFTLDERTTQLQAAMTAFLTEHVYPAEAVLAQQSRELESDPATFWDTPPIVEKLKAAARSRGCGTCSCPESTAPA